MVKMQQQIVYWGETELDLAEELPSYTSYHRIGRDVTPVEVLSDVYRNALFLLDSDASIWQRPDLFVQLPANAILYNIQSPISTDIQPLIALKNAQALDFTDLKRLAHVIHYDYFPGQWGYKLAYDTLRIAPDFHGEIIEHAQVSTEIRGNFGPAWLPLATWVEMTWSFGDWYETFYPECLVSDNADARFLVRVIEIGTDRLISSQILPVDQFKAGLPFFVGKNNAYIMVSVQTKGNGTITLGRMHVNRTRENYGHLFVGGQLLADDHELTQGVATYFDAGDLKPPLMVYFSGFKINEGFEGNFLMRSFHTPFLLIADNRLAGGMFYFGSEELETQIRNVILNKLAQLGFGPHDLILVGQSLGSTAALYYGAQLLPAAIVINKPLPDVGIVADEGRLNRPHDFEAVMDMLTALEGDNSQAAINAVNRRFWSKFKQASFDHTELGIAYMLQDDFQPNGFRRLYQGLANQNSHIQLLHKGFNGRHNDPESVKAVSWIVQVCRIILKNRFNREEVGGA